MISQHAKGQMPEPMKPFIAPRRKPKPQESSFWLTASREAFTKVAQQHFTIANADTPVYSRLAKAVD